VGYIPLAPGSWGSLLTFILVWILVPENFYLLGGIALIIFLISIWSAGGAEKLFGKDNRKIIIDECSGMLVSFLFLPKVFFLYILAYVIFRILDVVKPPPIRRFEEIKGGLGITLDDVVAGIYTNLILQILILLRILRT
jgi:phosphatidylglycerophosphatase A